MILNGKSIEKLIKDNILIEKANVKNIHSSSYDVTTSNHILRFKTTKKDVSLIDADFINDMYEEIDISDGYKFKPGECILIALEEQFNIPDYICASIRGRTSFNRLGIFISSQHLNPGYRGKLNITIFNNSKNTYILIPNLQIAQVIFESMDDKVDESLLYYNEKNPSYQNEDGLKGSKIYKDYIGKVVRHFKGNYYYIDNICMDSETKKYVVVYKTLYNREDSNIWVRPAEMFFETIDAKRKDNVTKQKHRFEIVDDLTVDYTSKNSK